jgi:hypothetical protein
MNDPVRLACQAEVLEVPLAKILPVRRFDDSFRKTAKFTCIAASVRELGLIEPLVVFPQADTEGCFLLLDGHVRLMILKDLGVASAKCLIAEDDEGFTYNHKVNRLSAIQEHFMILRALKSGVSEERLARALDVDIASIRQKRDLLDGICPEAVLLLRDRKATGNALRELRKVQPLRQVEIAELMCSTNNFSVGYARCLVASTAAEFLVEPEGGKDVRGLSPEDVSRMEHEMESLGREFKLIEDSHGKNVLHLVLVLGYLAKLLENSRVQRYLAQRYPEIQAEFQRLVASRGLADGQDAKAPAG